MSRISPTIVGVVLFYAYPILVLLGDYALYRIGYQTISSWVWRSIASRVVACFYLAFWGVGLILHLGFMFFPEVKRITIRYRQKPK